MEFSALLDGIDRDWLCVRMIARSGRVMIPSGKLEAE